MNVDVGAVYGLWNQDLDGVALLDRVVGEVGVNHVTIPAVSGPISNILTTTADGPRLFHAEAGWQYGPLGDACASHALKPRQAGWLRRRSVLPPVAETLARRGVGLVLRIDVAGFAPLRDSPTPPVVRSALGDAEPDADVCISNPYVRELAEATIEDLAAYGPAAIELVDWAPALPTGRFRPRTLGWDARLRELLDVCFCPACRQLAQHADVDADAAARAARDVLKRALGPTPDTAAASAGARWPQAVETYLRAVRRQTDDWLRRLAERRPKISCYALRNVSTSGERSAPPPGWREMLRRAPESAAAAPRPPEPQVSPAAGAASLWVQSPWIASSSDLVTLTRAMFEQGVRFLDFEGLEETPAGVDWLRQAVRYARRETPA